MGMNDIEYGLENTGIRTLVTNLWTLEEVFVLVQEMFLASLTGSGLKGKLLEMMSFLEEGHSEGCGWIVTVLTPVMYSIRRVLLISQSFSGGLWQRDAAVVWNCWILTRADLVYRWSSQHIIE